jgi:hypothetical protein
MKVNSEISKCINKSVVHGAPTPDYPRNIWEISSMTIYHWHHIVPKHAGGTDIDSNLIKLTTEEHADAHKKLYEQYGRQQDYIAWKALSGQIGKEEARVLATKAANIGKKHTEESRKNMSEGQKGKKYSNRKGKCSGEKNNFFGKFHSEETKEKMRKQKIGKNLSDEHRKNISRKLKGVPKKKIQCPHCGKIGGSSQMKRHHFDNCKTK